MTSSFTSDADLELAHRLADAAGEISMAHFGREIRRWAKEDGSLATEADVAVEDALRALLARERPDDAVLGEENGESGRGHRNGSSTGSMARRNSPADRRTWDLAAPSIIVEEAGGRFTNLDGHVSLTSGHALFTNGVLHDEILRLTDRGSRIEDRGPRTEDRRITDNG